MNDHKVPGVVCHTCGETIDGAAAASERARSEGAGPVAGSVSLCLYCGSLGVFERHALGYLFLREPTPAERTDMLADKEIVSAMAAIRAFHEGEGAALTLETAAGDLDGMIDAITSADVILTLGASVDLGRRASDGAIGSAIQARMFNVAGVEIESVVDALRVLADSLERRQ